MPNPDYMNRQRVESALFDAFVPDIAARVPPVPPVEITRSQWKSIQFIIQTLGDIVDDIAPNELETTLIQGKVIQQAAQKAWGLKHSFGLFDDLESDQYA